MGPRKGGFQGAGTVMGTVQMCGLARAEEEGEVVQVMSEGPAVPPWVPRQILDCPTAPPVSFLPAKAVRGETMWETRTLEKMALAGNETTGQ